MSVKLIYGPPGIGKSTLIRELQLSGKRALDLEILEGTREMRMLAASVAIGVGYEYIAMADVHPKYDLGPNVKKVLLWLPQAKYESRRDRRDIACPWKSQQGEHTLAEWQRIGHFDAVIDVDGPPWDVVYALMGLDRIL